MQIQFAINSGAAFRLLVASLSRPEQVPSSIFDLDTRATQPQASFSMISNL